MAFELFPAQAIAEALPGEPEEPAVVEQQAEEVAAQEDAATDEELVAEDAVVEVGEAATDEAAVVEETPQADEAPALVAQAAGDDEDEEPPVASVNGTTFDGTLQEAIDAAPSGATVALIDDVTVTETVTVGSRKNITLALGNYELTSDFKKGEVLSNEGTLVITGGKNGIISNHNSGSNTANVAVVNSGGNLMIESGNFGDSQTYGAALSNDEGTVVVNGGDFTNDGSSDVLVNAYDATMTINGGVFTAPGGTVISNTGNLTVTEGDFASTEKSESNSFDALISLPNSTQSTTIAGGTYETKGALFEVGSRIRDVVANVTRGEFSAKSVAGTGKDLSEYVKVSGGDFTFVVADDNCADGYRPTTSTNKNYAYTVKNGEDAVAGFTDTTAEGMLYYSLDDAIDLAIKQATNPKAVTVTLVADTAKGATIPEGAVVTITTDKDDDNEFLNHTIGGTLELGDNSTLVLETEVTVTGDVTTVANKGDADTYTLYNFGIIEGTVKGTSGKLSIYSRLDKKDDAEPKFEKHDEMGEFANTPKEDGGEILVYGGLFANEVPESICPNTYIPVKAGSDQIRDRQYKYTVKGDVVYTIEVRGTENTYANIASALDAVQKGQTIKLRADLTNYVDLNKDKEYTFDLNGHSIMANNSVLLVETGSVTITDDAGGGYVKSSIAKTSDSIYNGAALKVTGGTVKMAGGTFWSAAADQPRALYVAGAAGFEVAAGSDVEFVGAITVDTKGGSLGRSIKGGFYSDEASLTAAINTIGDATVWSDTVENHESPMSEDTTGWTAPSPWHTIMTAVASIGSNESLKRYATLQDAIDAAGSTSTEITLLSDNAEDVDVEYGKNITLALGSNKLTGTVTVEGKLAITNTGDAVTAANVSSVKVIDGGELTVGAVGDSDKKTDAKVRVASVVTEGDAKLDNNGTIDAVKAASGTLTIGPAVDDSTVSYGCFETLPTADDGAKLAITGGLYKEVVPREDCLQDGTAGKFYPVDNAAALKTTYPYAVAKSTSTNGHTIVARIGDVHYTSLPDAVFAAKAGDVINLVANVENITSADTKNLTSGSNAAVYVDKSITIDGTNDAEDAASNFVISVAAGSVRDVIRINGKSSTSKVDVMLKNLVVQNNNSSVANPRCVAATANVNSIVLDNVVLQYGAATVNGHAWGLGVTGTQTSRVNVTVKDSNLLASAVGGNEHTSASGFAMLFAMPVDVTVTGSTLDGWGAIYFGRKSSGTAGTAGSTATITNSTINSVNNYTGDQDDFGVFAFECDNITVDVTGTDITVGGTKEHALAYYSFVANTDGDVLDNTKGVKGCVVNLGEGNNVELGAKAAFAIEYPVSATSGNKLNVIANARVDKELASNDLNISAGVFSEQVPTFFCADGFVPTDYLKDIKGYTVTAGSQVAYVSDGKATDDKAYYAKLQDAIDAAKRDQVVTLVTDVDEAVTVPSIGKNREIKLDLAGHNLTSDGDTITVAENATLVLTDTGTYANAKAERASVSTTGAAASAIVNNGSLTIKDVAVSGGASTVKNCGTLEVSAENATSSIATKSYTALTNDSADGVLVWSAADGAEATIKAGVYTSAGLIFDGGAGEIKIDQTNTGTGTNVTAGGTYSADFTGLSDELAGDESKDVPTGAVKVIPATGYILKKDASTNGAAAPWAFVKSMNAFIVTKTVAYNGSLRDLKWNLESSTTIVDRWTGDKLESSTGGTSTGTEWFALKNATNAKYLPVEDEDGLLPCRKDGVEKPQNAGVYTYEVTDNGGTYNDTTKATVTILPYDIGEPGDFLSTYDITSKRLTDRVNVVAGDTSITWPTDSSSVSFDPYASDGTTLPSIENALATKSGSVTRLMVFTNNDTTGNKQDNVYLVDELDPSAIKKDDTVATYSGVVAKSYANNDGVNRSASVTVVGQGNFTGERTIDFVIDPITLANTNTTTSDNHMMAALDLSAKGGEVKPVVWYAEDKLTSKDIPASPTNPVSLEDYAPADNDVRLVEGQDYRLGYSSTTAGGVTTTTVTITGLNNYTGSKTLSYTNTDVTTTDIATDGAVSIYLSAAPVAKTGQMSDEDAAAAIADATLVWNGEEKETYQEAYTGSDITPALTVVVSLGDGTSRVYAYDPAKAGNGEFDDYFVATSIAAREVRSGIPYTLGTTGSDYSGTVKLAWDIVGDTPKTKVAAPVAKTGLVYDGTEQTGVEAGEGYTLSGTTKATEAGSYTATAALTDKDNTTWADGTTEDVTIAWEIAEPAPKPVDKSALTDEIFSALTDMLDVQTSKDGTDVSPLDEWVKKADATALRKAVAAAKQAGDEAATQGEVDAALEALKKAEAAFEAAKKDGTMVPEFDLSGEKLPDGIHSTYASYAHVQGQGDTLPAVKGGTYTFGTTGSSKRVEMLQLALDEDVLEDLGMDGGLRGDAHAQTYGWLSKNADAAKFENVTEGTTVRIGTFGESKRLESFKLELTGELAEHYSIWYSAHIQSYGWLEWARDGQEAGSAGGGKRMEALDIVILPKGETPADYGTGYHNGGKMSRTEAFLTLKSDGSVA